MLKLRRLKMFIQNNEPVEIYSKAMNGLDITQYAGSINKLPLDLYDCAVEKMFTSDNVLVIKIC